jgi:hypothetical protein
MISVIAFTQKLLAARNRSTDICLRRKSRGPLRFAFPFQDWRRVGKIIERKVDFGGHLGQKDYLSCMRRNGKRNHNRFPFFCLQVCRKLVDHFLTSTIDIFQVKAEEVIRLFTRHMPCPVLARTGPIQLSRRLQEVIKGNRHSNTCNSACPLRVFRTMNGE